MEEKNIAAVEFLKNHGIEFVTMKPETVDTFVKWAHEYLDERAAADETFAKVWNSQKEFGAIWYPYHKMYTLPHEGLTQKLPNRLSDLFLATVFRDAPNHPVRVWAWLSNSGI